MIMSAFMGAVPAAGPSANGFTVSSITDAHVAPLAAFAIAIAVGAVPLVIAYWPRLIAMAAARRRGARTLPPGLTPFSAAVLSGLNPTDLLACGFLWIIARTPHQHAPQSEQPAVGSNAEGYLRESLCPPGELENAGEVARTTLAATNPSVFEIRAVMAGLRGSSNDDARNLGLLRDSAFIHRLLLGLAGCELLLAFLIDQSLALGQVPLLAGILSLWAAVHVDPRSYAGANLTGDLRRLRADLRKAALATGSIDSAAIRALVPAAANGAEIEVWAMAAGCRTAGSERAVSRLRSMVDAASGRPRTIRYTEMFLLTGEKLADSVATSFRAVLRVGRSNRRSPDGAAPVIW